MRYLVTGDGPGFVDAEEALDVLENLILPSLDALLELERNGRILGGGVLVGERTFVFIVDVSGHDEIDRLLRGLPMWGAVEWEVTALQTFAGRAAQEREFVDDTKNSF